MKITASECQLVEKGNCPDAFDFIKTLEEFKIRFFNYKSDKESFDNDFDTAVVLVSNEIDHWEFFRAVYALKPDGFLFEKIPNGVIVYVSWDGIEEDE